MICITASHSRTQLQTNTLARNYRNACAETYFMIVNTESQSEKLTLIATARDVKGQMCLCVCVGESVRNTQTN